MPLFEQRAFASRSGFALPIALLLMAFMLMLLMGLSALTQVEIRNGQGSETREKARYNALLGMQIALGQLQTFAGPDQRVTAAAALGEARSNAGGDGLQKPNDGTRYWTGVWGNSAAWTANNGQPVLLNWLVSGNEGNAPAIETGSASFGRISGTVAEPSFLPHGTAPALSAATTAKTVLSAGGRDWGLLVGAGTAGSNADRYVAVPLVETGTGTADSGRYGWWVGDAGIKADVGLVDPIGKRSSTRERSYSFIMAQRSGGEELLTAYPVNDSGLEQLGLLDELPLVVSGSQTQMSAQLREFYHDVAVHTSSVFADALRGGLKKDLSAWLRYGGGPADTDPIVPGSGNAYLMPQWGIIRSYNDLRKTAVAQPARRSTESRHGLTPVITYWRLGYGTSVIDDLTIPEDGTLGINLFPVLVLWNPTNVPIKGEYEVMFGVRNSYGRATVTVAGDSSRQVVFTPNKGALNNDPLAADNRYFRFRIEATEIPPGASYVFALKNADEIYRPGENVMSHGGDPSLSVMMNSQIPVNLGESVQWSFTSGWGSINPDVLLREAPQNPADESGLVNVFTSAQNRSDMLNAVQYVGFNITSLPNVSGTLGVPVPQLQHFIRMEMTSNSYYLRWLANLNPRAHQSHRLNIDNGQNPLYRSGYQAVGTLPNFKDDKYASAGMHVDTTIGGSGDMMEVVAFGFQPEDVPLFSLAQLQHANLSLLNVHPGYAVGNSLPSPYIGRSDVMKSATIAGASIDLYDMSWHLNRALWDHYYFSTVEDSLSQSQLADADFRLPNARVRFHNADKASDFKSTSAFDENAGRLLLRGGFNVNSTSVEAWRALLSALNAVAYNPANPGDTTASVSYPFSRLSEPQGGVSGNWSPNDPWAGYRSLSAGAIDLLAKKIVEQVEARGPFLSVADFVNRSLKEDDSGFGGVLQSALNAVDAEATGADRINMAAPFSGSLVSTSLSGSNALVKEAWGGETRKAPYSSYAAFAPGYLTQADLLTAIGPVLTARSDTFTIRSYGDVIDPATGRVEAQAWCEAVVQRLPEYYDPQEQPHVFPPAQKTNQDMGRRFRIVSFRWLSAEDV